MSLINDALKQARQTPPRSQPNSPPPLRPVVEESRSVAGWLVPVIVILLIVAAIFFIGWASAHRAVRSIVGTPEPVVITQPVEAATSPVVPPHAPEPPPPLNPPDAPELQGIFYSPTAPSAIVDGKTVRPGDQFRQYRVKEIGKFTVTLVGPDKKEIKLGLDH
jgi:hypothetical protein